MSAAHSAAYQNATRIYNPQPDPLEQGPPKRVDRQEQHLGEMVAASKKRVTWTFTLGESDKIHEIVLTHSVMSYKKSVQYDGRQMHFSSTATPGDWMCVMILEGSNNVFEVRINDSETQEIPKYDLVIDRITYRKWDVYRRPHKKLGGSTPAFGAQMAHGTPSHDPTLAAAPPVATFGTHRWGPGGLQAPPAPQCQADGADGFRRPQPQANDPPKPKREINLIDDSVPDMTVSAPAVMFDPLVNVVTPPQAAPQPIAQGSSVFQGMALKNGPNQPVQMQIQMQTPMHAPMQMQHNYMPDTFTQAHQQQRPPVMDPFAPSIQNQNFNPNMNSLGMNGGMKHKAPSWNNSMPSCANGMMMGMGNSNVMGTAKMPMMPSATSATSALSISKFMAPEGVSSNVRPAQTTTTKEININAFDVVR